MNRNLILLFIFFIFAAMPSYSYYDLTIPVAGNTIADEELQLDVIKKLYPVVAGKYPACGQFSVKNTQILNYPLDLKKRKDKYVAGFWEEMWTFNACNKPVQIPLTFNINRKGATFHVDKSLIYY